MRQHEDEVREWLEKAREDLEAARRLLTPEPLTSPAAFHCQQAAEKALKAFLVSNGHRFRKVHNLVYLVELCQEYDPGIGELGDDVGRLNPFAVDERYPTPHKSPPEDLVRELLSIAERVLDTVEDLVDR